MMDNDAKRIFIDSGELYDASDKGCSTSGCESSTRSNDDNIEFPKKSDIHVCYQGYKNKCFLCSVFL